MLHISLAAFAQKTYTEAPTWKKSSHQIAYYGDQIFNPGLFYSYEYALINKVKTKTRVVRGINRVKYKSHRLEIAPNFTTYWDPQAHLGFIPNLTLQYKKINNRKWLMDVGLGIGAMVNYLPEVFTVTDGVVSDAQGKLNTFFAPSVNWSVGRELTGLKFGIRNHFLLNYNNTILVAPAITIGYRF